MMRVVIRQVVLSLALLQIGYLHCTDAMAITNARLLGALVKNLPATTALPLIKYGVTLLIDLNVSVLIGIQEPCPYH